MSKLMGTICSILLTVNYTLLTSSALLLTGLCSALYYSQRLRRRLKTAEAAARRSGEEVSRSSEQARLSKEEAQHNKEQALHYQEEAHRSLEEASQSKEDARRSRAEASHSNEEASRSDDQLLKMQAEYFRMLSEKEWLLKEVHHRVKNNLQLVISLLNMQTGYLKDEPALDAFGDIGSRIRAISIIHQRMYQEENYMAMINIKDYVTELISSIEGGLPANDRAANQQTTNQKPPQSDRAANPGATATPPRPAEGAITFHLNIDPIEMSVAQCVPLGLIFNEAITNSIKYAFGDQKEQKSKTITIAIKQQPDAKVSLTIADNGKGLPKDFDPEKHALMGFQLIRTMSDQLEGDLHWTNQDGLLLTLKFARQQEGSGVLDYLR